VKGLVVDDDALFSQTLQRALSKRGVEVRLASNGEEACRFVNGEPFDFALVDLKIDRESGLSLIEPLKRACPALRLVMMTGYASVATAVEAIKRGADDYLLKPVRLEAILAAVKGVDRPPAETLGMTPLGRVEWEHIQQALRETGGNVSAAARLLGVHRRSLQRKLGKKPAG
jgi:two-component system response regulator RegA